jgi:glycosyltransferase involved in cell wall biosynthesis
MSEPTMKALIVYLGRKGGGAVFSLELARALSKRISVEAIVSADADNVDAWLAAGPPVHLIKTYAGRLSAGLSILDWRRFRSIGRIAAAFQPDVVHYPMLHTWAPILNSTAFRAFPKVVTVHDPRPHLGERNARLSILLQKASIWNAARVVILSEALREEMGDIGVPDDRIDVIPHGEFSYYESGLEMGTRENMTDERRHTLLFFGRLREYKGLEVLAESFRILKEAVPDARLLVVGEGDFRPYAATFDAIQNVTIVNRFIADSEVNEFFARAGILVVPYVEASQSGVIPIAYPLGIPVVATDVGGLKEQVDEGVSGFLVPPGDPLTLANRCAELMLDEDTHARLSAGARETARTKMSWDHIADLTVTCFEKAIGAGQRHTPATSQ